MPGSIIVLFVANVLLAYAIAYDSLLGIAALPMMISGSITLSRNIADRFVPLGLGNTYIEEKRHTNLSATEKKHDRINGLSIFLVYAIMISLQVSFYRFEQKQIERYGLNMNASITRVYTQKTKEGPVRAIEYTYIVNGSYYTHHRNERNEALNDTLPIRVLSDFPDIHYIRNYTLRKPPLHRGRAVDYKRICHPYTPPAIIADKITRAPWAISYHEYGPWDMLINPVLVVIYPEDGRLKKVTLYQPDIGVQEPTEITETTITGINEKLAMTLACKLRSGNFPTEEMYRRKEERKDKLARRRVYDSTRFNFRLYSGGIMRDLFYSNLTRYFGEPNKEQVEAAIKLMRRLRDE